MRIALLSRGTSIVQQLADEIGRHGPQQVRSFDLSLTSNGFALNETGIWVEGVDLTTFDMVWVHGFAYENPIIPGVDLNRDWSIWQVDYLADQQTYSSRFSMLRELERRGVQVMNPGALYLDGFVLFGLFEKLRGRGFHLPELLCSNRTEAAEAFLQDHETVLWRPVTGRASWQIFQEKQKKAYVAADKPPVILGAVMPGPVVRSYLAGGEVVLCLKHQPPNATPLMESLEQFWSIPCPVDTRATLEKLAHEVGLQWGSITFVAGTDGPWIYDLDVAPILDWLPALYRDFLIRALAAALTKNKIPTLDSEEPQLQERPNLFLRRMLHILFQFEMSKRKQI